MSRIRLAMEHRELTLSSDDSRLLIQLTNQQCEPTKSGMLKFGHPSGTHDDLLWALALAVYADQDGLPSNLPSTSLKVVWSSNN
jgi:hypothetical protein